MVSGLIGLYVSIKRLLNPLKNFEKNIENVNVETFSLEQEKYSEYTPAEIISLNSSFKQLILRLKSSFKKQGRFINDAAHELRTPLARIKTAIQVLKIDKEAVVDDYIETYDLVEENVDEIDQILQSLLYLATNADFVAKSNLDLEPIMNEVIQEVKSKFPLLDITVRLHQQKVFVNETLIRRILWNLLENAAKYGATHVTVNVKQSDVNKTSLCISDDGIGIENDKINQITNAFYRIENSRNKSTGGVGLGLTLVSEMVSRQNGEITFESTLGEGTTAIIILPNHDLENIVLN